VAKLVLAPALTRWLDPNGRPLGERSLEVEAGDLRAALERLFDQHPVLRGYVLDDAGALRHHVAAFIDGESIADKRGLAQPLSASSEIYLMQALSGG